MIPNNIESLSNNLPSHPKANDPIIIEDPVNVMNNVGVNTYKILAIQQAFHAAHEKLKTVAVRYNSSSSSSYNNLLSTVSSNSSSMNNSPSKPMTSSLTISESSLNQKLNQLLIAEQPEKIQNEENINSRSSSTKSRGSFSAFRPTLTAVMHSSSSTLPKSNRNSFSNKDKDSALLCEILDLSLDFITTIK